MITQSIDRRRRFRQGIWNLNPSAEQKNQNSHRVWSATAGWPTDWHENLRETGSWSLEKSDDYCDRMLSGNRALQPISSLCWCNKKQLFIFVFLSPEIQNQSVSLTIAHFFPSKSNVQILPVLLIRWFIFFPSSKWREAWEPSWVKVEISQSSSKSLIQWFQVRIRNLIELSRCWQWY